MLLKPHKKRLATAPHQPAPVQPALLEPAPLEPSLNDEEAARVIGVAGKTMRNWRSKGIGPPWVAIGPKLVRYRPSDMRAYLDATCADRPVERGPPIRNELA
jgi:predicted DNA-binding transcriptional regulator AlpA